MIASIFSINTLYNGKKKVIDLIVSKTEFGIQIYKFSSFIILAALY